MEKRIHNKLKKDSSRSDDLLSSYSCSKFEKCSFEKNAFKDKSTDLSLYFFGAGLEFKMLKTTKVQSSENNISIDKFYDFSFQQWCI